MSKCKRAIRGRPIVPKLTIPDEGLGPAMLALTPGMRAFTYAKVFLGLDSKDSAIAAGYSNAGQSAKSTGYYLAHREDVQAAIREGCRQLMTTEGPACVRKLMKLRDTAKDERVRLKAAEALLARCGLGPVSESHVTVEHTVSPAQVDREIMQYAKELGLDEATARKLLVDKNAVIDGEFEEVPRELTPEETAAQAEREHKNKVRRDRAAMTPEQRAAMDKQRLERRSAQLKAKRAAADAARNAQQIDLEDLIDSASQPDTLEDLYA
jgi:phage terminase small subunit